MIQRQRVLKLVTLMTIYVQLKHLCS